MLRITALALLAAPLAALAAEGAIATLKDAQGKDVAKATLSETKEGVRVEVAADALPPGTHGFHVHSAGKCEAPDFKSAGPHFNPTGRKHGLESPDGAHAGDMPNLVVGPGGKGRASAIAKGANLGTGASGLFHEGGTALVVHADPDDMKTDPAGNSGARIACGVVERAK